MSDHRIQGIYRALLQMNRDAFADGEYDIAVHLLLIALRCSQRLENVQYLLEVEQLAKKESRHIDDHHPESEYSNKVAGERGSVGVFQAVAQKARIIYMTGYFTNGTEKG